MNDQELRDQCKREAEAKYPYDLFHANTMGPIRSGPQESAMKAHAEALFQERTKAIRLVDAGKAVLKEYDEPDVMMHTPIAYFSKFDELREAIAPYTQTKHLTQ